MVSSSSQNRPELIWEFQAEPALQKNQEASAKFKGVIDATGPKNSLLACQFLAGTDEASRRRTMIATFYKMHPVPSGVTSRHFAPKGERWEPPPSQAAHSRNKASSNTFAFSTNQRLRVKSGILLAAGAFRHHCPGTFPTTRDPVITKAKRSRMTASMEEDS